MLEIAFVFLIVQGLMGAFDTVYHREFKFNLPWQQTAIEELLVHSIRNSFYVVVFFSLAWMEWRGGFIWLILFMLLAEIILNLREFLIEDKTRALSGTERITHTLLALNYGLITAFLAPTFWQWGHLETELVVTSHGLYSWVLSLFAIGVLIWSVRDALAVSRLRKSVSRGLLSTDANNLHSDLAFEGKPKSFLIAGGSGYIGRQFSQLLINAGHEVSIYTRSIRRSAIHFSGKVTLIDTLDCIANNETYDVIINLAGASIAGGFWTEKYKLEILNSRVTLTKELYELCARLENKPKVFINASAVGYYGNQDNHICDESQDGDSSFSHKLCFAWEQEAEKISSLDIRLCILRFGVVLGPNGGPLAKMIFPFEFGLGGNLGKGTQWFSWVHIEDVYRIMLFCIEKSDLTGTFNATAPDPIRNKTLTEAIGAVLRRPTVVFLPERVIRGLLGMMGDELLLFSIRASSDKLQLEGFEFKHPNIKTTLQQLLNPVS